ncbi:MAG: ABC transporter substrate-binding protein [Chloroflexi bacterium]|nr:ABC transporter substrate-binding protein [Chloroflexota bacterium]
MRGRILVTVSAFAFLALGCAAQPAATATPTRPPEAAPTASPTKAPTPTPTKRPVVKVQVGIAAIAGASYFSVLAAAGKGYFEQEGLDIDWVALGSGAKSLAAVLGKSVPIGLAAAPEVIAAVAQGQPIKAFATQATGEHGDVTIRKDVAEKKGITERSSLADKANALKGLRIGATSPGSGTDYAIRYLLNKFNVDPERDVEITYVGAANLVPALRQGTIDVMSKTALDSAQAFSEGFGMVIVKYYAGDVPETNDNLYNMAISHKDAISAQAELLEAFTRGLWKGTKLTHEDKNGAREAVYKAFFTDMAPEVFRLAFDDTYLDGGFPKSPTAEEKNFRATLDYRTKATKEPPPAVKFEDFYTPKIVEAAKKQLGY